MKKKVLLVLFCVILAATGLTGCNEAKEPVEAASKTAEKTKTIELAEDFSDEIETKGDESIEIQSPAETDDIAEDKEADTEIQVQPKEEVNSQEVNEKEKPQKEAVEPKEETKEKPKQEKQKVETPTETEEAKPEPPRHTHLWEPVYAERQADSMDQMLCLRCGYDRQCLSHR